MFEGKEEHLNDEQKEAIGEISQKNGESYILSFSLSSVIDESVCVEKLRKDHTKVISDLSNTGRNQNQFVNSETKSKKDGLNSFKKTKKDKNDLNIETK